MEHRQCHEATFIDAEFRATALTINADCSWMRYHPNRLVREGAQGGRDELARNPDFVDLMDGSPPMRRNARQLPGPIADDALAFQQPSPGHRQRKRQLTRLQMNNDGAGAGRWTAKIFRRQFL